MKELLEAYLRTQSLQASGGQIMEDMNQMQNERRDADNIGNKNRKELEACEAEFSIAMRLGQRRVIPKTPKDKPLDLIEMASAHFSAKEEHYVRIIKGQPGFRKSF